MKTKLELQDIEKMKKEKALLELKIKEAEQIKTEKVIDIKGEGLESLLNKLVMIMCFNYFYCGKLVGVNDTFIKLENAHIVYETGPFSDKKFKDAQKISDNPHYIQISAIESYCETTKLYYND